MNSVITMQQMMMAGASAPVPGFTARYWRLWITATQANDGYINAKLIGLNAVAGDGTNRCPVVGGTVTASSTYGANFPQYAWLNSKEDGTNDQVSFWHSNSQAAPWWTIFDCGAGKTITANELALCGVNVAGRMPKDFLLQTSPDGSAWTTVMQRAGVTGWNTTTPKFFTLGTSSIALNASTLIIPLGQTGSRVLQPSVAGIPPYTWTSATLPTGLTLASDGTLSWDGTQTAQSTGVAFTVTDAQGNFATATLTLHIMTATIATTCFAAGERGGWYDPSDLSSMFQDTAGTTPVTATGQTVALLKDKSGNGNDLTQATSAARPTLQQDGNGNYYLAFAGAQFLSRANTNAMYLGTKSMMGVVGAKYTTGAGSQAIFARSLAGANTGRYWLARTSTPTLTPGYEGPAGVVQPGIADTNTTLRMLSHILDRIGGSITLRVAGAVAASATFTPDTGTNETNARRFILGAYNDSSDSGQINYLTGAIYGAVIRIADIDAEILNFAEDYMTGQIT